MLRLRMAGEQGLDAESAEHVIFAREVPARAAAPAGDHAEGRAGRPAHRRDRPRGRRLRGVPARDSVGLPGHDSRAGDDPGPAPSARRSSPPTGRARSATPCGGAASISSSSTRASRRRSASSGRGSRTRASSWPPRSPASSSRCGAGDSSRLPGVAETIDWAQALVRLHRDALDAETVEQTLGCLLKDRSDIVELPASGGRRARGRGASSRFEG